MAIRVYRVAVIGCPRAVIADDGSFKGVGKSCLCNRFVRPEAYSEAHDSVLSLQDWLDKPVFNGDHFLYWGASTRHLPDGTKVRFQIVEQTECYELKEGKLAVLPASTDYLGRATDVRVASLSAGKIAYRMHAEQVHASRNFGPIRATQLFPNEDFSGKSGSGIYGYVCVFDPTLEGDQMKRQLDYLSQLLHMLGKKKRKLVIACVKCDSVDETKLRYGSNLANYAMKKPVPFFEVSSRERVNVDEVFHALVSSPKKRKPPRNGKLALSGYTSYRDVVSLRKNDLSRARDEYRKLLQKKITDFSCVWSEVFPLIEKEPEFSSVLQLGGKQGKDIVKKMFCLRLIELKLTEAGKLYGATARKKVDREQSHAYQEYLSEAFRKHPDLGTESLYDYVYSPSTSSSIEGLFGLTRNGQEGNSTEPSTPSAHSNSRRGTPELSRPLSPTSLQGPDPVPPFPHMPRPRSAADGSYSKFYQGTESTDFYERATLPKPSKKSKSSDQLEDNPPPLPSREELCPSAANLQKSTTTQSQPFLLDKPEKPGSSKPKKDARKLSNSMEILLVPGGEKTTGDGGDPEPYMDPVHLKNLLGPLPPLPNLPPFRDSPASQFMSMRVPSHSRPPLPKFQTIDSPISPPRRSETIHWRGHRRTRSNPWVIDTRLSSEGSPGTPPPVPRRNSKDVTPPVPLRGTPKHKAGKASHPDSEKGIMSPIESSLDFAPAGTSNVRRPKIMDTPWIVQRGEVEDDNCSNVSGPFEEIDEEDREVDVTLSKPRTSSDPAGLPSISVPSSVPQPIGSAVAMSDDEDDLHNQYAKIEEFQYMPMAAVVIRRPSPSHSGTYPPLRSPPPEGTQVTKQLSRSRQAKSFSQVVIGNLDQPRRQIPTVKSAGPSSPEWRGSNRTTSTSSPAKQKSPLPDHRPLPPSPTKPYKGHPLRKISSGVGGANIYEVIDEDFVAKVKSRKTAHGEETTEIWSPPVESHHLQQYLEIVQSFFKVPEVYQRWLKTVRSIAPDEDPKSFPPPFCHQVLEEVEEKKEEDKASQEELPRTESENQHSETTNKLAVIVESPKSLTKDDSRIPVTLSPLPHALALSPRVQPRPRPPGHNIRSPLATRPMSSPCVVKKAGSRDDLIEMMNQQLNQGLSSDSETEDSDSDNESEGTETDSDPSDAEDQSDADPGNHSDQDQFDHEFVYQHNGHSSPGTRPQHQSSIMQTDLDVVASALRNSVSTDSELGFDAVKPPRSNSREIKQASRGTEVGQGQGLVNLVLPRKPSRRRGNTGDDRNLSMSDSGISQTFEDGFSIQNAESEC